MKLLSLTSNNQTFLEVNFKDALNVVLADRDESATNTDSRNGLGKTTLVALIDYCLGGQPGERIQQMQGRAWTFTLTVMTRAEIELSVTRSVDDSASILLEGDLEAAGARVLVGSATPSKLWLLRSLREGLHFLDRTIPTFDDR